MNEYCSFDFETKNVFNIPTFRMQGKCKLSNNYQIEHLCTQLLKNVLQTYEIK